MVNSNGNKGQSLVEAAVVLPFICLMVVVVVQMLASCHNAVLLQKLAYQDARELSAGMMISPPVQYPLWGRGAMAAMRRTTTIPKPWRPFRTPFIPTVSDAGHITTIRLSRPLLPTFGFGNSLTPVNQSASAVAILEPPAPQQG